MPTTAVVPIVNQPAPNGSNVVLATNIEGPKTFKSTFKVIVPVYPVVVKLLQTPIVVVTAQANPLPASKMTSSADVGIPALSRAAGPVALQLLALFHIVAPDL
jgi:hypothetical protein